MSSDTKRRTINKDSLFELRIDALEKQVSAQQKLLDVLVAMVQQQQPFMLPSPQQRGGTVQSEDLSDFSRRRTIF